MRELFPLARPPLFYIYIIIVSQNSAAHIGRLFSTLYNHHKSSIVATTVAAIFIIIHHRVSFTKAKKKKYGLYYYNI